MACGYCQYHQKYLDSELMKVKRCRSKLNTHKPCRHLILTNNNEKSKYKNSTRYISKKGW